MKKFLKSFREFAMRGNVIDLAVGVIIGAAFKAIVDSLVGDIISPLLGLLTGKNFSDNVLQIGEVTIGYGAFITAVLNFLLISLVLYLIITAFNRAQKLTRKPEAPPAPTTKVCPYCKTEIPLEATRCPHCTSHLE